METTFNKILLSQDDILIEAAFEHEKAKMQTLSKLPALLKPFGLEAGEAKQLSWIALESKIKDTFLFPNATEEHNLNCLGLAKEFHDLKEYYRLNTWCFDAKILTQEDKDAIIEKYRIYTSNENQNEAIKLFNTVKDSLLKLKDLGVVLDLNKTYIVSKVLIGDHRESPALKIDSTALYHNLINLK